MFEKSLIIDHEQEEQPIKRGRKKKWSPIGALSTSGNSLHGIIDIALLQSCVTDCEVKPFVKDYGMVIVDECQHVPAVNFERVLKEVTAGLTATPIRKDGLQPIFFMQCGPIRYTSDSHQQIGNQCFTRLLVPRFTPFRFIDETGDNYANVTQQLAEDEHRNRLIVEDVRHTLAENARPLSSPTSPRMWRLSPRCCNRIAKMLSCLSERKAKKKSDLKWSSYNKLPMMNR